jgi:hypothetical protein
MQGDSSYVHGSGGDVDEEQDIVCDEDCSSTWMQPVPDTNARACRA